MTEANSSGPSPTSQTIGPGSQAVFTMDYDPRTVNVQNTDQADGACLYVWIYAATTPVTPTATPVNAGASLALKPPSDSSGDRPKTLVIYNTGDASLTCTERSD